MYVSATGLSHHTAPVSVRERFAFDTDQLPPALKRLGTRFGGAALLSTCNRTELYLATPEGPVDRQTATAALIDASGEVAPEGIGFYHHTGADAVRHLFRVAAGIESLVIGESEILGQVRLAFSAATAAGSSNPVLARVFHSAIRVGRRARSETEIGSHGVSVSATAVALSRQALGDLRRKTILVVGAGDAARLAGQALIQSGAGRILVTTRTFERARDIAAQLNGAAFPFSELSAALAEADIVIASTSAPDFVIGAEDVASAMRARAGRPLVIVDIAVPRDVEPSAGEIANVRLFDIDDLQAAAETNRLARQQEVAAVEEIVEFELDRFETWYGGLRATPTIARLRSQAEAARKRELERTLARLGHLSEADRRRIDAMTKALVKRILHEPVTRLRDGAGQRHLDALRDLFGLNSDD